MRPSLRRSIISSGREKKTYIAADLRALCDCVFYQRHFDRFALASPNCSATACETAPDFATPNTACRRWCMDRRLCLLKNVFGVGIGRRMILAETCSWAGQHIGEVYDRCEMNEKFWAPLRVTQRLKNAKNLYAEAGASVGGPLRSCGATFVAMMQIRPPPATR